MSLTCLRPAQNLSDTSFKQVSDKIDVMEFGLMQLSEMKHTLHNQLTVVRIRCARVRLHALS